MSGVGADAMTPSVAALADGGFVVVWRNDQNGGDVKAQLFAANGSKRAAEFRVSAAAAGAQTSPTVAALDSGGFVVAWNSDGDVKSQAFDLSGQKIGAEFTVDLPDYPTQPTKGQFLSRASPEVADLAGAGYVIAWSLEDGQAFSEPEGLIFQVNQSKPQVQVVADNGTARGGVIDAAPYYPMDTIVHVAGLTSGGFYLTYQRTRGYQFPVVTAQLRDATGALTGGPADTRIGSEAAVAGLPSGGFVQVGRGGGRQSVASPLTALVGTNDGPLLGETATDIQMTNSAVAGSARGYSFAAFEITDATFGRDIGAQLFGPSSMRVAGLLRISSVTAGDQVTPDVIFLTSGRAVVVWRDAGTRAIKGQMVAFDPPA